MQYMILIYSDESQAPNPSTQAEVDAMMAPWFAYNEKLKAAGVFVAGDALLKTSTAVTVRERDGQMLRTDGPFAETREQLGGYYLIDCGSMEEAVRWGQECPGVHFGSIEVRQVMVLPA